MMQRDKGMRVRAVERYEVDSLGAPFRVVLLDSVVVGVDTLTGQSTVQIPDLVGLIGAVVRARVSHTRKLSAREVRFVRKALGVRAALLARFLDMTPEHLSRCETGTKVMSSTSEKMLRLWAFLSTFYDDPEKLLVRDADPNELKTKSTEPSEMAMRFMRFFLTMKIQSAFNIDDGLSFEFKRCVGRVADEGEWLSDSTLAA
jgi:hypothetical protein